MSVTPVSPAVTTQLAGSVGGSTSSVLVKSASGFPGTTPFWIQIDKEVMIVTGGATTKTWTVARATDGTVTASHDANATVVQVTSTYTPNAGAAAFLFGSGAPSHSAVSGTYYFRTDTPGTANQRIYINSGAGFTTTWTALV